MGTSQPCLYFAYGSNMNPDRMKDRKCKYTDRRLAKLKNYAFTLNKLCSNGTAAANIMPKDTHEVFGALYTCNQEVLNILDKFEGVKSNHYYREKIFVELKSGAVVEAVTYIAHSEKCSNTLETVAREYIDHILSGRDILPKHYVEFLETFQSWCKEEH